jgi:hypothetical protein
VKNKDKKKTRKGRKNKDKVRTTKTERGNQIVTDESKK